MPKHARSGSVSEKTTDSAGSSGWFSKALSYIPGFDSSQRKKVKEEEEPKSPTQMLQKFYEELLDVADEDVGSTETLFGDEVNKALAEHSTLQPSERLYAFIDKDADFPYPSVRDFAELGFPCGNEEKQMPEPLVRAAVKLFMEKNERLIEKYGKDHYTKAEVLGNETLRVTITLHVISEIVRLHKLAVQIEKWVQEKDPKKKGVNLEKEFKEFSQTIKTLENTLKKLASAFDDEGLSAIATQLPEVYKTLEGSAPGATASNPLPAKEVTVAVGRRQTI